MVLEKRMLKAKKNVKEKKYKSYNVRKEKNLGITDSTPKDCNNEIKQIRNRIVNV